MKIRKYLIYLILILVLITIFPSFSETIKVTLNSINIKVNGRMMYISGQNIYDSTGKYIPSSIVYDGRSYVPLGTLAKILDKNVEWNSKTNTVSILPKTRFDEDNNMNPVKTFVIKSGYKYYSPQHSVETPYLYIDSFGDLYVLKYIPSTLDITTVFQSIHAAYLFNDNYIIPGINKDPFEIGNGIMVSRFLGSSQNNLSKQLWTSYKDANLENKVFTFYNKTNDKFVAFGEYWKSDVTDPTLLSLLFTSITDQNGNDLLEVVNINNSQFYDLDKIVKYLGIDYSMEYDEELKTYVLEVTN